MRCVIFLRSRFQEDALLINIIQNQQKVRAQSAYLLPQKISRQMSESKLSVNQQLANLVQPNRCISKMGVNMSQQFVQLKRKQAGDISVLSHHNAAQKRMQESNKLKEDTLVEEGKLKIINSDLKRAKQRNSVKDTMTMEGHLADHAKRIRKEHQTMQQHDPKTAAKIKLERISPVVQVISAFKSPSRNQLQDYEAKESKAKPNASTYRPRYDFVLNKEARPTALIEDKENPGRARKRELFEKKQLHLCQRLAEKLDRGHEMDEQHQLQREDFLDNHPRGFQRRGSDHPPYLNLNSSSRLLKGSSSPSMNNLSRKNLHRSSKHHSIKTRTANHTAGHTAQQTGRESSDHIQITTEHVEGKASEQTVENFIFKRDNRSIANRTGDGQISLAVSRMNSITYDDEDKHGPSDELKIGKQRTNEDMLRNTQPKSILPAVIGAVGQKITDFALPQTDDKSYQYENQSPIKIGKGGNYSSAGKLVNQALGIRHKSKPNKFSMRQPMMMSKIDSQLSIQHQVAGLKDMTRSVSVLHMNDKNRPLPTKVRNNSIATADMQKGTTKQTTYPSTTSLIDLTQSSMTSLNYKSGQAKKLGYEVAYKTNNYHLVRNRNFYGNEDGIQLLPNYVPKMPTKLPSVKMNLQIDRPPNLAQLHDARFEESNKDPTGVSTHKKVKQIDFNKQTKQDRHECLINVDGDVSMQKYNIKDSILKKRILGTNNLSKQKNWDELVLDTAQTPALESHDALKAAKQLVHSTSGYKSGKGGVGLISLDKQAPRQFTHFQVAELSAKQQREIELAQDEDYVKTQKQLRQKAVMNIHSRLGEKYNSVPRMGMRGGGRQSLSPSRLQQVQDIRQNMRQ